ncbi:MAG: sigma-54-dependent Fis family transcriptional regulator, partial [Bacteroidetes bacterium]|nr:sigma-54-dependent Fis family transcriptional regulator [Bacteroidota bacterium]
MTNREAFQQKYGIIGQSTEMQEIMDVIKQVAPTDITVLITGESGTGKEVIAKAIHGESRRAQQPMVSVNCGAIPEGLIESELFGHEKGAFTSALEMRRGYFEIADSGTILLDEIGEMPLATQVKLLRVLESGEFMRVGSSAARKTDVRVIAATNKILEYEVQQKRFRPDLYFRLRSVNIHLPPLRNRKEDIPALVEKFIKETADKNRIQFGGFSNSATELLMGYDWPGNVRELRNTIESMIILESGKYLNEEDVHKYLQGQAKVEMDRNLPAVSNRTIEQAERELIYRALVELKSNIIEMKELLENSLNEKNLQGMDYVQPQNGNGILTMDEMERRMVTSALDRHKGNRRNA